MLIIQLVCYSNGSLNNGPSTKWWPEYLTTMVPGKSPWSEYRIVFIIIVMASGGLYSTIYINNLQSLKIIFVHWTQLSKYWTHGTDYRLLNIIAVFVTINMYQAGFEPGSDQYCCLWRLQATALTTQPPWLDTNRIVCYSDTHCIRLAHCSVPHCK